MQNLTYSKAIKQTTNYKGEISYSAHITLHPHTAEEVEFCIGREATQTKAQSAIFAYLQNLSKDYTLTEAPSEAPTAWVWGVFDYASHDAIVKDALTKGAKCSLD